MHDLGFTIPRATLMSKVGKEQQPYLRVLLPTGKEIIILNSSDRDAVLRVGKAFPCLVKHTTDSAEFVEFM